MTLVTSAAVEESIPDVVRARELGLDASHPPAAARQAAQRRAEERRRRRHQRQVDRHRHDRLDPARAASPADGDERRGDEEFRLARARPFASALVGDPELFVSEVDESDGRSRFITRPSRCSPTSASTIWRWTSCGRLFGGLPRRVGQGGAQPRRSRKRGCWPTRCPTDKLIGYGFDSPGAMLTGRNLELLPDGVRFTAELDGERHARSSCSVPGRHNAHERAGGAGRGPCARASR